MNCSEKEYEIKMLKSSLQMHKKTLLELDENSPARDIICADIEKINARLWELKEPTEGSGYEKVNGNYNTIEIICNSENTINIKPFMITRFSNYSYYSNVDDINDNTLMQNCGQQNHLISITIDEYYSEDFCLPLELEKLISEKDFTLVVSKKTKNGNVLYSFIYKNCNVYLISNPSVGQSNSEAQCWDVVIKFAEREIYEASNKETTEYTTYQEENGKESIER